MLAVQNTILTIVKFSVHLHIYGAAFERKTVVDHGSVISLHITDFNMIKTHL